MAGIDADARVEQTGTTIKRRGILAAAGAVVAGIVAKQTAQPVGATTTDTNFVATSTIDTNFDARGSAVYGVNTGLGSFTTGVHGNGNSFGVYGISPAGTGVSGVASTSGHYGVEGSNTNGIGVYGHTGATNTGYSGVYGGGAGDGSFGVVGDSNNGNTGAPSTGIGVFGRGTNGAGVWGTSTGGSGVYGSSTTGYGVLGYTTGGSASLSGISTDANIPAFAGGNSVAGGLAASFAGTVYVNGMFVVADMTQKHGLLKHPDGSHRLMYTVEAPESWVEDFGKATFTNGKASVTLDSDFAVLIHADEYHVFLTEYSESNGLYVSGQTASGFTVQERNKGIGSGRFSWRVVAKPKSEQKVERLGKFVVPSVPLPDVAKLPKPAEMPLPPAPLKKP